MGRLGFNAYYAKLQQLFLCERKLKAAVQQQGGFENNHRILDCGCGPGHLKACATQKPWSGLWVACDADLRMCGRAQTHYRSVLRVYAPDLPFHEGSFDHVVCSLFFHHLAAEDRFKTFQSIKKILKNEGKLHIVEFATPKNWWEHSLSALPRWVDGWSNTAPFFQGDFKKHLQASGFACGQTLFRVSTCFGPFEYFQAWPEDCLKTI